MAARRRRRARLRWNLAARVVATPPNLLRTPRHHHGPFGRWRARWAAPHVRGRPLCAVPPSICLRRASLRAALTPAPVVARTAMLAPSHAAHAAMVAAAGVARTAVVALAPATVRRIAPATCGLELCPMPHAPTLPRPVVAPCAALVRRPVRRGASAVAPIECRRRDESGPSRSL
eukprot:2808734-Prymnesium_polylepis.2